MKMNNRNPYYSQSTTIKKKNEQAGFDTNIVKQSESLNYFDIEKSENNSRDVLKKQIKIFQFIFLQKEYKILFEE